MAVHLGGIALDLTFTNRFTTELPADPIEVNQRRQVHKACFSRVTPVVASAPELVAHSREVAADLGIADPTGENADEFLSVFAGNTHLDGMDPYAMCYGGHQFGNWAGQLGDGRAIALGEIITPSGEHQTLQLKGAGPTPYSRSADGMAVLRSSIREFLCSEAMHHLGVPTTRALSLITTGDKVVRDMFYDGNAAPEPGAVVCRVAPSFVRFGSFEILAAQHDIDTLKQLADFTIRHDFPHLPNADEPTSDTYAQWFTEIATHTADMIVHWMRVGFVHGVMNTDNMSILGLTIDYGPYGWVDNFDADWTPNTTDFGRKRYRFANQPHIAYWNLAQLGNSLVPLVDDVASLQAAIDGYIAHYSTAHRAMMLDKLGLSPDRDADEAEDLVAELLRVLQLTETDFTIFFRRLAEVPSGAQAMSDEELLGFIADAHYTPDSVSAETKAATATWIRRWLDDLADEARPDDERKAAMNAVNPKYVIRNYLAQLAIDKSEQGDHSMVNDLLEMLRNPYDEQPQFEEWAAKRPDWARSRPGCSTLSCSS